MAKKRIITQDLNHDEDFNKLIPNAQLLFLKFLTISDDCGVIPANEYTLHSLINLSQELKRNYSKLLENILSLKLMKKFTFQDKNYLCFKQQSFFEQQKFLIKNRTRSEYLKISIAEFSKIYSKLQELPVIYSDNGSYPIESIEYKDQEQEQEIPVKVDFSIFWNLYDKKVDRNICFTKWQKLSLEDQQTIIDYTPDYVSSTPMKKYRKNPEVFLNKRAWENEIIGEVKKETENPKFMNV